MNRMQEWLSLAAEELGLRIETSYKIELSSGRELIAQAYFPDLSNPNGILVFDWEANVDVRSRHEIEAKGMGVTTFGEPGPNEQFDIEGNKEMFSEWGWAGKFVEKPSWMIDEHSADEQFDA